MAQEDLEENKNRSSLKKEEEADSQSQGKIDSPFLTSFKIDLQQSSNFQPDLMRVFSSTSRISSRS